MAKNKKIHYLIFFALIAIGVFFRFYLLEARTVHHDESLHALYAKYFYNDPGHLFYKYDPMLHGPLLYNILPFAYHILGTTILSARLCMALFGTFLLFIPFVIRNRIGNYSALLATLLLSFSPTLIYWSRFIRHDILVLFFMGLILLTMLKAEESSTKVLTLPVYFFLLFCIKENYFIYVFHLCFFLILDFSYGHFCLNKKNGSWLIHILNCIKKYPVHLATGLVIGIFFFLYFYSAGFRYTQGILDFPIFKAFRYWWGQHRIERIPGPFSYHFLITSWYESPLLLLAGLALFLASIYSKIRIRYLVLTSFLLSLLLHLMLKSEVTSSFLNSILRIKIPPDAYLFSFLLIWTSAFTFSFLALERRALAFFTFITGASFFTYSYLGEKVPWLTLYCIIPLIIIIVLIMEEYKHHPGIKKVLGIFLVLYLALQINTIYRSDFKHAGEATELLSQVHTTPGYQDFAIFLQQQLMSKTNVKVLAYRENFWPLSWFLYGLPGFDFSKKHNFDDYTYILTTANDDELDSLLKNEFQHILLPIRWWWLPKFEQMGIKEFFTYLLIKKPWNPVGQMQVKIYGKKVKH